MKNIIIFTLDGCSHCESLKQRLKTLFISFDELEINRNQDIWNQVVEQTGHNVIPMVYISNEGEDEGIIYVPGRDYQNEDEIVEIVQKISVI